MMYKANVALCSEIRTKHSAQSEHLLNLMARKETARIYKFSLPPIILSCWPAALSIPISSLFT
jgi:hypothetical protein